VTRAPASGYPPDDHVLRDLRLWIERDEAGSRVGLEAVPELLDDTGALRAGVLGILIDAAAGDLAVRTAAPGWVATSDLVYHVVAPVRAGTVEARPSLLRRTRSTLVIEVDVAAGGETAALATLTFALLEAKSEVQRMGAGQATARTEFYLEHSRMRKPFLEAIGARVVDAGEGVVELPVAPYVGNSLGALQGGVVAALVDRAAECAAGEAVCRPCTSTDLAINYLSLGRRGPVRSRTRLLKREPDRALLRVELRDAGADDRLLTVATVTAAAV
jgi:acyl-coenzyme A thioesterase PaaI-like protein